MTKRLLAIAGLVSLTAASALASDIAAPRLPVPRSPATYVPFFTWSGAYAGINLGYGFGSSAWTAPSTGATTGNFGVKGMQVGGTLGYNMQMASFLFGVESDFGWSGIKGSSTNAACAPTCTTANNWMGTLRGRFGLVLDRFLPYFTGGMGYGNVKLTDGTSAASSTKVGWTIGGGVEYGFTPSWTVKVEYLFVNLGTATCNAACSGGVPFNASFKTSLVRLGLNYKF